MAHIATARGTHKTQGIMHDCMPVQRLSLLVHGHSGSEVVNVIQHGHSGSEVIIVDLTWSLRLRGINCDYNMALQAQRFYGLS